jgi:hypothetical protein
MALTIPKAGIVAGRAAQVNIPTPDIGTPLSQLGQSMAEVGGRYMAERLDHQGKKIQLDIARDMAAARLEAEQLGDPAAIGAFWERRQAEISAQYLDGQDENGNPRVPPQLRGGIELTLGELGNRHVDALARKSAGLVQSQRQAQWIELSNQVAVDASKADPETAGGMLEVAEAAIDNQVAAGDMTPAEAARQKIALRETVASARATTQMETDPEAFLKAAAEGQFDDLGAEKLATRQAQAQAEIYRRAAAETKAAEVEAKARDAAIGKRLGEMTDLFAGGFKVVDEDYLTDPEVVAHEKYPAARAAQELRDEIPNLKQLTPAELTAAIAAEEAAPKTSKYQVERVAQLRAWRDQAEKRWTTEAKVVAGEAGMKPPPLAFDPAAPQAFTDALGAALSFDAMATQDGYTETQALVTPAEKAALAKVIDPKADTAPKLALVNSIVAGAGAGARRVLTVLDADPVFRRAVWTVQNLGDQDLAEGLLRGQQKAALGTVTMPAPRMMQQAFDAVTGGAFDDRPDVKKAMMDAAAALYADGASGIDPESQSGQSFLDDSAAIDLFTSAVQRVTGATPDRNGKLTVGGVQQINDGYVSLPVGIAAAQVETALESLDYHLRGQRRTAQGWDSSATDAPPDPLRAFRAASVDGRLPDLGANPAATLAGLQMQRVLTRTGEETDQYRFVRTVNGRAYPVADAKGVEYRFRLPALIREAGR